MRGCKLLHNFNFGVNSPFKEKWGFFWGYQRVRW